MYFFYKTSAPIIFSDIGAGHDYVDKLYVSLIGNKFDALYDQRHE